MPRYINVEVSDSGNVSVTFGNDGEDHFTKREQLRVIKTIKHESRQQVKAYRRKQRLELVIKGASDARDRPEQSSVERTETVTLTSNSREGSKETTAQSSNDRVTEAAGRAESPNSDLAAAVRRIPSSRLGRRGYYRQN